MYGERYSTPFYLIQKNPSAIRSPEEDLGAETMVMDHEVAMDNASNLDHHVKHMCKDAGIVIFRGEELKQLLAGTVHSHQLKVDTEGHRYPTQGVETDV